MATATPDSPDQIDAGSDLTEEQREHLRNRFGPKQLDRSNDGAASQEHDHPHTQYNASGPSQYDADNAAAREGTDAKSSLSQAEQDAIKHSTGPSGAPKQNGDRDPETDALEKAARLNGEGGPNAPASNFSYTGDAPQGQDTQPKKGFVRRNKWKLSIGGLILGTGTAGVVGFSSFLLPLKVMSIVQRLETLFNAAPNAAMQKMADNLFNEYVSKYVLPGINTNLCTSTIEPTCVGDINASTPIGRLFQAWKQNHIETKLATNNKIVFGKQNGQLYMAVAGENELTGADLAQVMSGQASIFDVGSTTNITEARSALRASFKDASLWDKVFFRFSAGKLIEEKYGVTRCIIACQIRDKFTETIALKKSAAFAAITERVIEPVGKLQAIFFGCLINPDQSFCKYAAEKVQNLGPGETLDEENLSPLNKYIQSTMQEYTAAQLATDSGYTFGDLTSAVNLSSDLAKKGIAETIVEKALTAVFGDTIGQLGSKAVPIVGWVLLAAQVIHTLDNLGPLIRFMSYAMLSLAAVKLYMVYSSVSSEEQSGHIDATMMGSFTQSVSTNLTGSASDQVDATDTPLYNALLGDGGNTNNYTCNDGSHVPAGQLVCPEEKLDRGNGIADGVSKAINFVPGLAGLATIINWINDIIGTVTGAVLNTACNTVLNVPPGSPASCPNVVKSAGQYVQQLASWLVNILVPSPFSQNMSGGRTFDMVAAGADVSGNKVCQLQLGCAKLSNQQIADIRGQAVADQKAAFNQEPVFARMFSTTNPYSLLSQLALVMPTSLPDAATRFGNMVGNPIHTLASAFASIFATNKAFAAPTAINDPFGVTQYGYDPNNIPRDPQAYSDQHNCAADTGSVWMSSLPQDPNTGEPLSTSSDPCLLLNAMVSSTGTQSDSSFAPAGSLNTVNGEVPGGNTTSGTTSGNCSSNGNYNALVSGTAYSGRIDQGVDFATSSSNGFDICAPAAGTITLADASGHPFLGTPGQALIIEKLDAAPNAPNSSQYIYYAEIIQINSTVHVGLHVNAGDILGHSEGPLGIEVGWGKSPTNGFLCGLGAQTPCGISFNNWVKSVSTGTTPQ